MATPISGLPVYRPLGLAGIVYTTLAVPGIMLLEAVLSFLGLGVPPPAPTWGPWPTPRRTTVDSGSVAHQPHHAERPLRIPLRKVFRH